MTYNPALDGLRALAVLLVVALHCHVPGFRGGAVGVDVFFVLSGYLITSILLAEHARTGRIGIGAFYWRRALRLYPALLLFLVVYLLLAPLAWPGKPHGRDALIAGLYLSDYVYTFRDFPVYLGHTWSLAAEEHFYLLWPLALLAIVRKPQAARYVAALVVGAWLWRLQNQSWGLAVGYRFDTRAVGMLAGCWLAFALRQPDWLRHVPLRAVALFGMALLGLLVVTGEGHALPLAELAGLCLIVGANTLPLTHPALVWLGKLSYGIYLWHFPLIKLFNPLLPWPITLPLVLALSIGAAWVSFNSVEAWARSRRHVVKEAAGVQGEIAGVAGALRPLD